MVVFKVLYYNIIDFISFRYSVIREEQSVSGLMVPYLRGK